MTSPSPGQIARYLKNSYYKTVDEYLFTLADVMTREYRAIVEAGFILQLDCPDLAMSYALYPGIGIADYRKIIAMNVEALNHSIKDLPADRMRMHVCWGSTLGPHHGDVPLKDIADIILKAQAAGRVVPRRQSASRPRVEGVEGRQAARRQDHHSGRDRFHLELRRASRACRRPHRAIREGRRPRECHRRRRTAASAPLPGRVQVDTKIVWMKLASLAEGARLASKQLW